MKSPMTQTEPEEEPEQPMPSPRLALAASLNSPPRLDRDLLHRLLTPIHNAATVERITPRQRIPERSSIKESRETKHRTPTPTRSVLNPKTAQTGSELFLKMLHEEYPKKEGSEKKGQIFLKKLRRKSP